MQFINFALLKNAMKKLNIILLLLLCCISSLSIKTSTQLVEVVSGLTNQFALEIDQIKHIYSSQIAVTNSNIILLIDSATIVIVIPTNVSNPTSLLIHSDRMWS